MAAIRKVRSVDQLRKNGDLSTRDGTVIAEEIAQPFPLLDLLVADPGNVTLVDRLYTCPNVFIPRYFDLIIGSGAIEVQQPDERQLRSNTRLRAY